MVNVARRGGFTLVELLVVLAIIGVLLSIATPRYTGSVDKAREAVLRENLSTLREAIDKYYADTGRYPSHLAELVERRYLRRIPTDPITESNSTWKMIPPPESQAGAVFDVRSGAEGKGRDGTPYGLW